jgi:hypothetical protein
MVNESITPRRVALGLGLLMFLAYLGPTVGLTTFFYRDFGVLAYPTAVYHHEMFWRGELPLWNPYSNCGVPFLAQWGTMTLYPFSLFYLLLPLPWSLNFFCLAHLWFGALGVFYLARRWTKSSPGSALASVVFLFNGITLSTLAWPNYTVACAWMPWIIIITEQAWRNGRRSIPAAALAGAMQMLSGAPELILLTWGLITALLIWEISKRKSTALKILAVTGSVALLIAGLCAIQLLPFMELLSLSHRQAGASATKWALPFTALGNFFLPLLHAFKTPQGTWHQFDQTFLSSTYLGLPALLLAIIGAIRGGTRARILAAACALCVFLALGPNLPTFALIQKLPVIGFIRYPVKYTLLMALLIPLLAAYGLRSIDKSSFLVFAGLILLSVAAIFWTRTHPLQYDRWPETFSNCVVRLVAFAAAFALLQAWLKKARREYFLLLLLVIAIDGRFNIDDQNPVTKVATVKLAPPERGLPKLGEGRIFITPKAEETFLKMGMKDRDAEFIGKRLGEWSHLNLLDLVPKVNGSATLVIREQKELIDWLYDTNTEPRDRERWLNFVGATEITSTESPVEWTSRSGALPLLRADRGATVETLRFSEHEIIALIKAPTDAALTIAQTKYPGWRAEKDGQPLNDAELVTEKGSFQLYALPAGIYQARIFYRDDKFIIGAGISLLSLTACCALFGLAKSRL